LGCQIQIPGKVAVHYATVNANFMAISELTGSIRDRGLCMSLTLPLSCGVQENQTLITSSCKEYIKILHYDVTACNSPTVLCEAQYSLIYYSAI
jgi:hypothetical protein